MGEIVDLRATTGGIGLDSVLVPGGLLARKTVNPLSGFIILE